MDATAGEISPELLEACRRGDRDAFRTLYEAYNDRIYSIAFGKWFGRTTAPLDEWLRGNGLKLAILIRLIKEWS